MFAGFFYSFKIASKKGVRKITPTFRYRYTIHRMKKVFFFFLVFSFPAIVSAQNVFAVDYASQADIKIIVVPYESQADLKVFKVKYESQAKDNKGKWFFTAYASQAKKKLFYVDYESQADLKIFFVKYESQAGWRNASKRHLFY